MLTTEQVQIAADKFTALTGGNIAPYLEACVHCGQCAEACHFYEATGDARYTPAYKLVPITRAWKRSKSPLSWFGLGKTVKTEELEEWQDLIFDSCTMCGRCSAVCPMGIDISAIVAATRQAFAAAGMGPEDFMQAAENVRTKGSPLGLTSNKLVDRLEWLEDENDMEFPLDKKGAEILLTVSSIEMMKYPDSIVAMGKLLDHAGVSWTFSTKGYEATNFGFLSGKMDLAKLGVTRIVEAAEELDVKTVVIPECGHAYGVMRWSGANILGRKLPFEVLHITEFLADLKRAGKLKLKPLKGSITYHDPCQISRRGGAADAARYLLDDFAEDFREMTPTANFNWCCGGGGGVQAMASATDLRHKVFKIKMDQVEATGADTMVSSCANCRLTMDESIAHWKWDHGLNSLVEVMAENLIE
ncbi:MAG: (Fe-S)-binding protein [Robiginitomaculum sp.]|nr:MAG: (Fe-S)-binding protein [Robiginitomaculum sp.]